MGQSNPDSIDNPMFYGLQSGLSRQSEILKSLFKGVEIRKSENVKNIRSENAVKTPIIPSENASQQKH
jgi:hypothetical protein